MNVLHVLDHSLPLHSGYVFRSQGILGALRGKGVQTHHVTGPKQGSADRTFEDIGDFRYYRAPAGNSLLEKLPLGDQVTVVTKLTRRITELCEELKPDIIHTHSPCLNGLAALNAAKRTNTPLVYEVRAFWEDAAVSHGSTTEGSVRYRLTRGIESYVLKRANHAVTICEGLRTDIVNRGIASNKISVVGNAVDSMILESNFDDPWPSEIDSLRGRKIIGFFGSFYGYEGLTLLVQALPKIIKDHPDATLLLLGSGPDEPNIRKAIAATKMEAFVHFTGRVPHDQIPAYYRAASVMVFPRLPMRLTETVTPLKPLEAMIAQRPVVASDVGGHKELIDDRDNGYLFPAGDREALAELTAEVLGRRDLEDSLARARQRVLDTRTWPRLAEHYLPIYERLSQSQSSG